MPAAEILIARQGDTLDELLWRERGLGPAELPVVLDLNPGVARLGATLPAGTRVTLPDAPPTAATVPLVNLWD